MRDILGGAPWLTGFLWARELDAATLFNGYGIRTPAAATRKRRNVEWERQEIGKYRRIEELNAPRRRRVHPAMYLEGVFAYCSSRFWFALKSNSS